MKEKLKAMLETGVHFGHQVRRWNAKMAPYIYEEKNGIHILDIVQTVDELEKARVAFKKCLANEFCMITFFWPRVSAAAGPVDVNAAPTTMTVATSYK